MGSVAGPSLGAATLLPLMEELAQEAQAHRFEVAPNPCVGAAVLSGGRVVGRGHHRHWGGPHAEVEALAAAREAGVDRQALEVLVVTLEPCCSQGKTGPCTRAIVEAGIRHVVIGALDPDSRHRGRGVEELRAAGIEVSVLEGAVPLEDVAPHFLRWTSFERLRRPRPWLIAKWAQTLTGQLSPPEDVGDGRWISGLESRRDVQLLRARVDAIVTGVGTVLADDPLLSLRPPVGAQTPPDRVVLDSYLRTPPEARLFAPCEPGESAGAVHVLCLPGSDANRQRTLVEAGAMVHGLRGSDRKHLLLRKVASWLWDQGYRRVLLEAGPALIGGFIEAGFVDQLRVFTASVRGGRGDSLADRLAVARLLDRHDRECGEDSVLEAFL